MEIKVYGATFATLELALDIAANQRAMNRILLNSLARGDAAELQRMTAILNQEVSKELALLRARLHRHAELNLDDPANDTIDI